MRSRSFAQFWQQSTGYVEGSLPPRFEEEHVKPIHACGSDSIYWCDNRMTLRNRANIAREVCRQRKFIGFTIEGGDFMHPTILRELELI